MKYLRSLNLVKLFKKSTLVFLFGFSLIFFGFNSVFAQNNSIGGILNQSWSKITYMVDKQPIFDVSQVENIIISEIVNNLEREDNHTIDVYDEFVNQVTNIDGLKLIDRDKTNSLLKELDFQRSGYVNENQITKIGKFYSSGLIVFGRIQADEFSQSIKKNKTLIGGNGCPEQRRVGWYQLNVNLKIIDLKTAEVVFSENIRTDVRKEGPKYNCEYPPSLSSVEFFQIAKENIGAQFRELFTVHQKEYEIDFQTHKKFNDGLKHAITLLEIDDFDGGFAKIKEIAQTTSDEKARSFALYNLAKMQLFNGEYDESLKNAKQAYLLNPKNDACLEIINELK